MNRVHFALSGVFCAALLFTAGCATTVTGVRQDQGLTGAAIIEGKMAIGGVFSNFETMTDQEKNRHATNLRFAIQEAHEKYEITPMPEVRNKLGKENYEKIMQEYKADGLLSPEALAEIKGKIPERYLALVRIEEDNKSEPTWRSTQNERNQSRGFSGPGVGVGLRRTLKVTALVYDLKDGKKVWDGLVTTTANSYVDYPVKQEAGGIEALAALISGQPRPGQKPIKELYPPPAPPALFELLPEAYLGFAKALPKK